MLGEADLARSDSSESSSTDFSCRSQWRISSRRGLPGLADLCMEPEEPLQVLTIATHFTNLVNEMLQKGATVNDFFSPRGGIRPQRRKNNVKTEQEVPMVKVMVVDDSPFMRRVIVDMLQSDPEIQVTAVAKDGVEALEKLPHVDCQVITLDVEMPRMDGLAFLRQMMQVRPLPVVMLSSLTSEHSQTTLEALSLGAVDFVAKPGTYLGMGADDIRQELIRKVKAAVKAQVIPRVSDDHRAPGFAAVCLRKCKTWWPSPLPPGVLGPWRRSWPICRGTCLLLSSLPNICLRALPAPSLTDSIAPAPCGSRRGKKAMPWPMVWPSSPPGTIIWSWGRTV